MKKPATTPPASAAATIAMIQVEPPSEAPEAELSSDSEPSLCMS
jgi:hypothetical protein